MSLSADEKKALKKAYIEKQNRKYVLKKSEAKKLFKYLRTSLAKIDCDHTLKRTNEWLENNVIDEERRGQVIGEIKADGGYCDCEVLMNCYERYELE